MAGHDWGPIDRIAAQAEALAGAWGGRARASTTIGQERAILRLFGVTGLDPGGRPLAGATVDRWLAGDRHGLAGGIALPFAMALLEYDVDPQRLALDIASGAVDLAFEAELLQRPERRATAEAEARRLASTALERIDAERTVRRETIAVLGDATRPWIGTTLREPGLDRAVDETLDWIGAGVDLLRVEVPIGRELADRLHDAGRDVPEWKPAEDDDRPEPAPTGSQRALAVLRRTVDQAAAERRAYVRLATVVPALGAPEGAVVAAFERIDLVASDAMSEIVADSVEPERALADQAFAHRVARRAGNSVLIGAGPLVVAPDMARGIPSDPATRAGRALALQLVGVALARDDGLGPDQLIVGALPAWLEEEPVAAARAIAEVAVRRLLFQDLPFAYVEPSGAPERSPLWGHLQAAAAVHGGDTALVLRLPGGRRDPVMATVGSARAAVQVAAQVTLATEPGPLAGTALEHARGMVTAARDTLDRLADGGWRTVAGEPLASGRVRPRGGETVGERTDPFDPFDWGRAGRG